MAIAISTFSKLLLSFGLAAILLTTPSSGVLLSGVSQSAVNSAVSAVLHAYNLHTSWSTWFHRHVTGDVRCNAEANSKSRIYWGQGIGSFVQDECNHCTAEYALQGIQCTNKKSCSDEGQQVTNDLAAHARAIDNNADDYLLVQEAAKQTLETLTEVQLKYGAPLSNEKQLFSCIHSYAKELNEDVIKTDNNGELLGLYFQLIHKI